MGIIFCLTVIKERCEAFFVAYLYNLAFSDGFLTPKIQAVTKEQISSGAYRNLPLPCAQ